jgi:hypothetical protein
MLIIKLLYVLVAYLLPCLASMRAVVTKNKEDLHSMVAYWIIYCLLEFLYMFILRIPHSIRILISIWLTAPHFQGEYYDIM